MSLSNLSMLSVEVFWSNIWKMLDYSSKIMMGLTNRAYYRKSDIPMRNRLFQIEDFSWDINHISWMISHSNFQVTTRSYNAMRNRKADSNGIIIYWKCEDEMLVRVPNILVSHGNIELLEIAVLKGFRWNSHTTIAAARCGHLHVLKYLVESNDCKINHMTLVAAIESNRVDCFKYLYELFPFNRHVCRSFMNKSDMMVSIIDTDIIKNNSENVSEIAADEGCIEMLVMLKNRNLPWSKKISMFAAASGDVNVLRFITECGSPKCKYTCKIAAENGNCEGLEYAIANGYPVTSETVFYAIDHDCMRCLKLAKNNSISNHITGRCIDAAASNGNLHILKYCRLNSNYPTWSNSVIMCVQNGHLDCLKFCLNNGAKNEIKMDLCDFISEYNPTGEDLDLEMRINECIAYLYSINLLLP